jgi:hypothetical protein
VSRAQTGHSSAEDCYRLGHGDILFCAASILKRRRERG